MVKNRLDSMLMMLAGMVVFAVVMPAQAVVYVDKMAPRTGGEDGLSWATAFDTIQEGIDLAATIGNEQVWVAGGPNGGGYIYNEDRPAIWGDVPVAGSLILEDGVYVYGGFEGYWGIQETAITQRNPRLAVTIIDGSQSRGGAPAYHVVVVGKELAPVLDTRIDGFVITGGNASGIAGDYHTWRGGGLFNYGAQVKVANCYFVGNIAAVSGGAIANEFASYGPPNTVVENCVFFDNLANRQLDTAGNPIRGGGAIFSNQADIKVYFSTFVNNRVNTTTGGLYGLQSGGFFGYNTTTAGTIFNSCIFWNNTPNGLTCLQTLCGILAPPGCGAPSLPFTNGTQNQDPLFVPSLTDFELQPGSPFIDAGDSLYLMPNDIRMGIRPQNAGPDRGAYETVTAGIVAVCRNDQSVSLDNTGQATAPAVNFADLGASVVPGGLWRVQVGGSYTVNFNCSMYPSTTIRVRLIENSGRWAECDATVTVNDLIAPTAVCKNITVYLNNSGTYTLTAGEIDNGSSDNCSVVLSIPPTTFTCANAGTTVPVQLTVTDPANNTAQCTANVTVRDNTPPTVITKSITVQLDGTGNASILPSDVDNGTTDNCGIANLSLDKSTFTCADIPSVIVNLTAVDVNDNSASAPALIVVQDNVAPIVVTKDITVQLDNTGQVTILPSDIDNGSSDNCGIDRMEVDPSVLTCADLGTTVVNLVVYDVNGNVNQAPATITVEDNIVPTALTKNAILSLDASGQLTVLPSDVDNGSFDNCPIYRMEVVPNTFTCADIGSHVVTLTVYDEAGNSDSEDATVTVRDNLPPTVLTKNIIIDLDANGTASIVPQDVNNGSSDNCGIDRMELDKTNFTCTDLGANVVNLTVYDVNSNSNSAPATVTVRDVTAPVITVNGSEVVYLKVNVHCYTELGATWTDACDGSGNAIIGGDTPPTNCPVQLSDLGDYVITYNYTDSSGNPAEQKIRTLHVIRNYPPVINLLGDNPMTLDCKEPYVEPGYTATDLEDGDLTSEVIVTGEVDPDTPGTYMIEYKVTDHDPDYPETTIVYRTVDVVDNNLPVLSLDGPTLLAWQLGEPWVDPGYSAEDYCWGDVTDLVEITGTVDVNNMGTYLLIYTPKDGSGNSGESKERIVYVGNLLQIVEHPYDVDAYTDSNTFELSVTFTGGIFIPGYDTYLWYRDTTIVNTGALETGMNTIELVVDPTALSPGTYMYHAELVDLEKVHVSGEGRVRIADHVTITGNIYDAPVTIGENYSMFLTVVGGIGELHYQWQKQTGGKAWENLTDGGNISGTTTNTLSFTPFEEGDGGQYRCVITDDYMDVVYSNVATLTEERGIPVAGIFGLSMITVVTALAGAFTLRRHQK